MTGQKKQAAIAVVATLIAAGIIGGGYFYHQHTEAEYLAEEKTAHAMKVERPEESAKMPEEADEPSAAEQAAERFTKNRAHATVADYLAYAQTETGQANVSAIYTLGTDGADWLEQAVKDAIPDFADQLHYQRLDNTRQNGNALADDDTRAKLADNDPALIFVLYSNASDHRDQLPVEQSVERAKAIYGDLRIDYPNANVVFLVTPAESKHFNTDGAFQQRVTDFTDRLKSDGFNVLSLVDPERNFADDADYGDDGLSTDSLNVLKERLTKELTENALNFSYGLGAGDKNDEEIAALKQAAAERQAKEEAERKAAAERQAAAERERKQKEEAERKQKEAQEAEQKQQQQQPPQNGQQQQPQRQQPQQNQQQPQNNGQAQQQLQPNQQQQTPQQPQQQPNNGQQTSAQ